MSLEQLSKTVDFVQATTPSNANDGETWLDTSQSPPQLKVFDSSANAFVRPRSIQNLDAPVSNAGATQSDIKTAVDNSNTASTVSANLDAPVSDAGGVNWTVKTPKARSEFAISAASLVDVTGSGYVTGIAILARGRTVDIKYTVDGNTLFSGTLANEPKGGGVAALHRFESSFKIEETSNDPVSGYITWVFD